MRHVERAGANCVGAFHDVEANHGGGDIGMAGQVLDGSDAGMLLGWRRRGSWCMVAA